MTVPETISIDLSIFSLDTVKRTALRYTSHYHVEIREVTSGTVEVILTPRETVPFVSHLTRNFRDDLLDQDLRSQIAQETQLACRLILAQAFSHLPLGTEDME